MLTPLLFFFQNSSASSSSELDEGGCKELTLVVGNCRHAGGMNLAVGKIIGQAEGDFTHEKSFLGSDVLSVDICPLSGKERGKYPHAQVDFAKGNPLLIMEKIGGRTPGRIFFEWFPSCNTGDGVKATALLMPALVNASKIVGSGGEIIIDHCPYAFSLPTDSSKALEALLEHNKTFHARVSKTFKTYETSEKFKNLAKRPGIVSALLQREDPFTIHISQGEHEELRSYLMFIYHKLLEDGRNSSDSFDDSQCNFIKGKTEKIDQLLTQFAKDLDEEFYNLAALISNGMRYAYSNINEEQQGHWHLFEQKWYMLTRDSQIKSKLGDIGFSDVEINYFPINPYNQRKYAWLIMAKKK